MLHEDSLGKKVVLKTAQGYEMAHGEVIAYSNAEMICIQDEKGNKTWWRADLAELENVDEQ